MDRIIDIKDKPIFDFIKFLMEHKKLNKYNERPFETRYVVENMNFSDLFIDKYIKHEDIKYIYQMIMKSILNMISILNDLIMEKCLIFLKII